MSGFAWMKSSGWIARSLLLSRESWVGQSQDWLKTCSDPPLHSPACTLWAGLAALEVCHVACMKALQNLYIEISGCRA